MRMLFPLSPLFEQFLCPLECLRRDNPRMCLFNIVLISFPVIDLLAEGKARREFLLTQGIANVFLIGEDIEYGVFAPLGFPVRSGNVSSGQFTRYPGRTFSVEIALVNPANDLRFLRNNFQILFIHYPVSERRLAGDKLAPFHPPLIAHALVLRDGYRFLLCKRTVNAHHEFRGERVRTDILFFKVDRYAEGGQLPQYDQTVARVACEAGDGFDQYPVDFSFPAVRQHPVEIFPPVRFGAGQSLVRVHVNQLPAFVAADGFAVGADLRGIGMKLILGTGTDAAVGRHAQYVRFPDAGRYHSYACHCSRLLPCMAATTISQLFMNIQSYCGTV